MGDVRRSPFASQVLTYFGAAIIQGVLALALIPIATAVLGPHEFGAYGMALAAALFASAICELGCGIVLYGHYHRCDTGDRRSLVSTLTLVTAIAGLAAGGALYVGWSQVGKVLTEVAEIDGGDLFLMCVSVPLRALAALWTSILIVQSRAVHVSLMLILQAVGTFGGTVVVLFAFEGGQTALFAGSTLGVLLSTAIAAYLLRGDLMSPLARKWADAVFRAAPAAVVSGLLDSLRPIVESGAVTKAVGLVGLGLYNHAKLYHSFLLQGSNAINSAIWARALDEAGRPDARFVDVGRAWNSVYLGLTVAGIALAAFGIEIVSILTNGKFVAAAPWVPLWVAYLLLQNSGKPATATLYAVRQGAAVARYRAASLSLALVALVTFVPAYGIPAAIGIAFGEMLVFRLLLRRGALAIRRLPFQDGWVIAGSCSIALVTAMIHGLSLALPVRGTIFLLATAALLVAGWGTVLDAFRHVRQFLGSRAPKGKS